MQIISNSPGDLQRVFKIILESATRLCGASFGTLLMYEADGFRRVARHNVPQTLAADAPAGHLKAPFKGAPSLKRLVSTKRLVHIVDIAAKHPEDPVHTLGGARSILVAPMLKEGTLVGCINVYRREVRPFTDKQISLIESFAAQAVIAIENARLLNELRESLAQQTAMADVLRVISASPGDLKPVFDAMLGNAARLCEAELGSLIIYGGGEFRIAAAQNFDPSILTLKVAPDDPLRRVVNTAEPVHIADVREERLYKEHDPTFTRFVDHGGARTLLVVPLLKENDVIGVFAIHRQEVRPFNGKQIGLVTSFAAQAVIAIENARLLTELRESLEQQTAMADVLRIISASPGDLQPVFTSILENASRICQVNFGILTLLENDGFRVGALYNAPPAFAELRQREPLFRPLPSNPLARVAASKRMLHIEDLIEDESYLSREPAAVVFAEGAGARTVLLVPMLKETGLIGIIGIFRQEKRPFAEKQVQLLQNFAAQAVIAIENARLLTELRQRTDDLTESLEQQTATSNVLRVISSSPGDLGPVFSSMLENAARICDANFGNIYRWDGEALHLVATHNTPAAFTHTRQREPIYPAVNAAFGRVVATKAVIHLHDAAASEGYLAGNPSDVQAVDLGGVRTVMFVPMLKDSELVGVFSLFRQEVRPFTQKQIELVQNFAAQAVIAIENARLLTELRES
ncbi:MAG: GAF domain-containing protein, partial [Hyphomicrobiales bacterium]|nr:GAF domain-containing protein [Hyphomicrobiales bacterium]